MSDDAKLKLWRMAIVGFIGVSFFAIAAASIVNLATWHWLIEGGYVEELQPATYQKVWVKAAGQLEREARLRTEQARTRERLGAIKGSGGDYMGVLRRQAAERQAERTQEVSDGR